jgi:DNA-binding PadR family transcriptional regulator
MSVPMSLLAILDEGPRYGLQLKNEFEARTGGVWPLNPGQVYTTLDRLERDGLVRPGSAEGSEGQKIYEITHAGGARLRDWFRSPTEPRPPARDELVLKLIMALGRAAPSTVDVIGAERRGALELLQEYTLLKRDAATDADLGWLLLLDSLIFQAEARVRWLDACEARLARHAGEPGRLVAAADEHDPSEVSR